MELTIDEIIETLNSLKARLGGNATVVMMGDAEGNNAHTVSGVQYTDDKAILMANHRNVIEEL